MSKAVSLFSLVSILFLLSVLSFIVNAIKKESLEFQYLQLQHILNYSTDAATFIMLTNADRSLNMDVNDLENISVNPEIALNTFTNVFLINHNMITNEVNRYLVRTRFIPVFAVVVNDGFYLSTFQQSNINMGRDSLFDLKYSFTKYMDTGHVVNLTISQKYMWKYTYSENSLVLKEFDSSISEYFGGSQGIQREINNILISHISSKLNSEFGFFVPNDLNTVLSMNPIQGVSVIALVQNVNLNSLNPIHGISVGGTRIITARLVVGYYRDGIPFYAYSDLHDSTKDGEIVAMFTSFTEAALAGFNYDLERMNNINQRQPGLWEGN